MKVKETFVSIQGESTFAGFPCFFIRLSGCNLRCSYCDTASAYVGGVRRTIPSLVESFRQSGLPVTEITGGEPLLQKKTPDLAAALLEAGARAVLVETNGSLDIGGLPPGSVAVVDVKCPGSGMGDSFNLANLDRLRRHDEVKFVLSDRLDFEWAAGFVKRHELVGRCGAVLFSPVMGRLDPKMLAGWLVEAKLPVRLQIQLHKTLGMA
jgi:7-carboxy-7-deazaguanine synthase